MKLGYAASLSGMNVPLFNALKIGTALFKKKLRCHLATYNVYHRICIVGRQPLQPPDTDTTWKLYQTDIERWQV